MRYHSKQAETADGRKGFVELKHNLNHLKVGKKVFPMSDAFEIGGHRIILADGKTTFVFYSDVARTYYK